MRFSIHLTAMVLPLMGVGLGIVDPTGSALSYGQTPSVSANFRSDETETTLPELPIPRQSIHAPMRPVSSGVPPIVQDAIDRQDEQDRQVEQDERLDSQEDSFEKIWRRKSIHDTRIVVRELSADAPSDRSEEIDYGTGNWLTFYPAPRAFYWEAPNIRYRPLYFEDVELERYGRGYSHPRQMLRSALHFAKSTAMLPHKMWHDHPFSCDGPLGFARPGTCTPSIQQWHYYGHRSHHRVSSGMVDDFDYRFE